MHVIFRHHPPTRDPSVNDYVTQSGVTLTVLPSGGLSAVVPQTFGFGTSPVFSFVDAQVSDLGTWVAFTRFGSCSVIEAETDITASFTTTLSAPLGTAATYTVCYSLDGGSWNPSVCACVYGLYVSATQLANFTSAPAPYRCPQHYFSASPPLPPKKLQRKRRAVVDLPGRRDGDSLST